MYVLVHERAFRVAPQAGERARGWESQGVGRGGY